VAELLWALHHSVTPDPNILAHKGSLSLRRLGLKGTRMGPLSCVALAAFIPQYQKFHTLNGTYAYVFDKRLCKHREKKKEVRGHSMLNAPF
jgi:hypothetical protein